MKNFQAKPPTARRYMIPAILFVLVLTTFLVVLAVVQIRGSRNPIDDDSTVTRTVTVAGLRGEIFDCNGKLLVGNETSYDLIFEYGAMPDTRREINASLLEILKALSETGNGDRLAHDYYVLEGTYPSLKFCEELSDQESNEYYYYKKFLQAHALDEKKTNADDVVDYFVSRYKLSSSLYTDTEITALLRLLYEMERVGFGAYQSYTIATDVNMSMITRIEENRIEGASFTTGSERVYAYPGIASHILGRVGKITAENADHYSALGYPMDAIVGIEGCEKQFESWLRGQDGTMVIKYDKDGNVIEKYYEKEPVGGNDVYLTIDIDLQIAAEKALAENIVSIGTAKGGACTVLDPNTGALLAAATYPTYDLTRFDDEEYVDSLLDNPYSPFLNRALNGVYAPGSTYKMGVALAALQNGAIDTSTCYDCYGAYPDHGNPKCTYTHAPQNKIDVRLAIQSSCNVFFYSVVDKALSNISEVTSYTTRLGLGVPTGIELPEAIGTVAGPGYSAQNTIWTKANDIHAAIGQSDHAYTPLQISVYTASLANGGTRYAAHILDSVRTFRSGEYLYTYQATVMDSGIIDPAVHQTLMEAMGLVVSANGEVSRRFARVPVTVGGKTGTAEYTGKTDYALFTGFAPFDAPEIVATCIIDEGQHGYLASETVAAVFEKYFEGKQGHKAQPN